jgi:hypothetical protein
MRKSHFLSSVAMAALVLASPVPKIVAAENNISALLPDLYDAIDVVSRELVGFLPGVARSASAERAAVNQPVTYHIAPVPTAIDITPAMQVPEPADQTIGSDTLTITKSRAVPFGWVGEAQRQLNTGPGTLTVQGDMIAQALRVLVNEMESDLATTAALAASRATGTAGTTPFATNLADAAQLRKILDDNGAPSPDARAVDQGQ